MMSNDSHDLILQNGKPGKSFPQKDKSNLEKPEHNSDTQADMNQPIIAHYDFSDWWIKLYRQMKESGKINATALNDSEAHDFVVAHPSNVIFFLYNLQIKKNSIENAGKISREKNDELNRTIEHLRHQTTDLSDNLQDADNKIKILQGKIDSGESSLTDKFKQWHDKITDSKRTIEGLKYKIADRDDDLEYANNTIKTLREKDEEYTHIQEQNDELELRCARLVKEITVLNTGGVNTPQHELLYKKFKELKEQKFKALSNKFYKLRSKYKSGPALIRKRETANIRSMIAETILLEEIKDSDNSKLAKKLRNKLFEYCSKDASVKFEFPTDGDEIYQDIKSLVEESLKLVNSISRAQPPGELLWCEKDKEFNPEEHEVLLGCAEYGKVKFTVYPGYVVYEGDKKKKRIFAKVLVFTKLEK
jgi:peptidoglycan hydrolase CwlO-like protein